MTLSNKTKLLTLVFAAAVSACGGGGDAPQPAHPVAEAHTAEALAAKKLPGSIVNSSATRLSEATESTLIFYNRTAMAEAGITFARLVGSMLVSAGVEDTQQNRVQFVQNLLNDFKALGRGEGDFIAEELLGDGPNGIEVVAVLNRVDSRQMVDGVLQDAQMRFKLEDRGGKPFHLILEYGVPSNGPGEQGYEILARAWDSMKTLTATERAEKISQMAFIGLDGLEPIAKIQNLQGENNGEFRINSLNSSTRPSRDGWMMAGYRIFPATTPQGTVDVPDFKRVKLADTFAAKFLTQVTKAEAKQLFDNLTAQDRAAKEKGVQLSQARFTNYFFAGVLDKYQPTFQMSDDKVDLLGVANEIGKETGTKPKMVKWFSDFAKASGLPLNGDMVWARLSARSCYGCHGTMNGEAIGAGTMALKQQVVVPNSLRTFLQITKNTSDPTKAQFSEMEIKVLRVRAADLAAYIKKLDSLIRPSASPVPTEFTIN